MKKRQWWKRNGEAIASGAVGFILTTVVVLVTQF
jgi:hypothetical protein